MKVETLKQITIDFSELRKIVINHLYDNNQIDTMEDDRVRIWFKDEQKNVAPETIVVVTP